MELSEVIARTPWIPAWFDTGASMDRRHILWLYEVLKATGVKRTLEIGSYHGCSSSAFIAAGIPDAHFADISVHQRMRDVIGDKGTIHQRKGCDVLRDEEPFDLVLLDGAHDLQSVREELDELQVKAPQFIVAHDTNSTNLDFPYCEGAWCLWDDLSRQYPTIDWDAVEDTKTRAGEMTGRGMLIAFREHDKGHLKTLYDAQRLTGCL
jgi:hypothetical protein